MEPPPGCSWEGDWHLTHAWDTTMPIDAVGEPVWFREALELDGHEDCCHHTREVLRFVADLARGGQ